ncbi:MAG: sigma-70 family RNA polymerase sigma factor [Betaproteobacteria bacterium]|nr:sigma-70 family RNA polymerase sigma factor [Betaproteobacteria bacterium]
MATPQAPASATGVPSDAEIEGFRAYLLRYALLQLRDLDIAEDAVQETLLAALQGRSQFARKSSTKTWLTGILKHKIIDHLRRQAREQPLPGADDDAPEAEAIDAMFLEDGHWRSFPANWGDPARSFEDRRFWEVFELCASMMSANVARVFVMREVMELSTEEICKELNITPTNCWVMLHRARMRLRECLEVKWFAKER